MPTAQARPAAEEFQEAYRGTVGGRLETPGKTDDLYLGNCRDDLKRLAAGETLRAICKTPGMPAEATVRDWARDIEHPFADPYDRA